MFLKNEKSMIERVAQQYIDAFSTDSWDLELSKKRICEFMDHPLFRGYIYMKDNEVISVAFGILQQYYDGMRFFLTDLFTTNKHQNCGYASELLTYIKKELEKEEVKQIMLISSDDSLHNYFYDVKNKFSTREDLCIKKFNIGSRENK